MKKPEIHTVSMSQKKATGSDNCDWADVLINQVGNTLWTKNSDKNQTDQLVRGMCAGMMEIGPADVMEGMIAAQLIASHNAAMECYRRAMINEQTFEGRRESLNYANKLSRTHATLVEALNRHRGKGQQKVTVEHVHVHAGGQAVVGNVNAAGGGLPMKSEDQPHALTHAPSEMLHSQVKADRQGLPVTSR